MKNRNGSALLLTVGILAVLILVAASMLSLTYTESFISSNYARDVQAWYLAESGIEKSLSILGGDPAAAGDPYHEFDMSLNSGKLEASTHVKLIQPDLNGFLTIISSAQLNGGGKRTLEAVFTAPPWYVVYCETVRLNSAVDIIGVMNSYGIETPPSVDPPADMTGSLVVDAGSSGAYQYFENDQMYFANHTHRFHAPAADIGFYRKLDHFRNDIDWRGSTYAFSEDPWVHSGSMCDAVCASAGDIVVYGTDGEMDLDNVVMVAGRDIWVINLGSGPTVIRGRLLAGRDLHLYQMDQCMTVRGALLAGRYVDLHAAGGEIDLIHDNHPAEAWPAVLRGKTGSLALNSLKEVY